MKGAVHKSVKSFATLRKIFKAELYRYAKLVPRPSDVDFAMGPLGDKEEVDQQDSQETEPIDEQLLQDLQSLGEPASKIYEEFKHMVGHRVASWPQTHATTSKAFYVCV